MAVKALSHYLGGHKFLKPHKIVFVKRSLALKILGYGPENTILRSSHFALYATYIELCKEKENAYLLDPFARREFLHDNKMQLVLEEDKKDGNDI